MEEINFKPSIKPDIIIFAFIAFISLVIILIISIIFPAFLVALVPYFFIFGTSFFGVLYGIVVKYFTTYTITDNNEIIISYSFLGTKTKLYRVDQITSVTLYQSLIGKIFGLSTIKFGIFGKSSMMAQQPGQQQQMVLQAVFSSIKNADYVFEKMTSLLGVELKDQVYKTKPKASPVILSMFVFVILSIVTSVVAALLYSYGIPDMRFVWLIVAGTFIFFFLFGILVNIFSFFRLRRTDFSLMKKSLLVEHNYFFSRMREFVPYNKITNVESYRNVISYALFNIIKVRVFTGGDRDPIMHNVGKDKSFMNILSYVVKSDKNVLTKELISRFDNYIEKPQLVLKPGKAYFFGFTLFMIILSIILLVLGGLFSSLFIIIGLPVVLLFILLRVLIWKNISYEFYDDKIITSKGVISIERKEIFIRNIKYAALTKPIFFQNMFGEGTIMIFTAGTSGFENSLVAIKEPNKIYKILVNALDGD